jgi:hypothetical protein
LPSTKAVAAVTEYLAEHLVRTGHQVGGNHLVDVYRFSDHSSAESLAIYGRTLVQDHYFDRDVVIRWLKKFDLPELAKMVNSRIPRKGTVRTGDVAEMLAIDYAEKSLGLNIPVRKLRHRSARNFAMFGDDALGLQIKDGRLFILRVEAKNYPSISLKQLEEIYDGMSVSDFLPTEDTLSFAAKHLKDDEVRDLVEELQARSDLDSVDISLMMFIVYEKQHSEENLSRLPATRALWPFLAAIGVCLPERKKVESLMFDADLIVEDIRRE